MIKKLFSIIVFSALISNLVMSQSGRKDRSKNFERLKAKKIAYITDELELTPAESEKFWPVYNQFRKDLEALRTDRQPSGDELNNLTEAEALAILNNSIQIDKKEVELKEKYNAEFVEIISAKRLIKLHSVDRRFKRQMLIGIKDRFASRKRNKG